MSASPLIPTPHATRALTVSMLLGSFAWGFAFISLPFPLVVARVVQQRTGSAVGIVNSARIGASFVGPVLATSVLAVAPPVILYLLLAAAGLACVPLALVRRAGGRQPLSG